MESIEARDILDALKSDTYGAYTEAKIAEYMKELLMALDFLHKQWMIHKNLSIQNIQFADKEFKTIKLVEISLMGDVPEEIEKYKGILGNPLYAAPEILNGQEYDKASDIWSAGIICYILLSGSLPYEIDEYDDYPSFIKKVNAKVFKRDEMPEDVWGDVSDDAKDFVMEMIQKDPNRRANIQELLNNRWLKKAKSNSRDLSSVDRIINTLQSLKVLINFFNLIYYRINTKCSE